jgi:hypothetical protein
VGGCKTVHQSNFQKHLAKIISLITDILATVCLCSADGIPRSTVQLSSRNLKIVQELKVFTVTLNNKVFLDEQPCQYEVSIQHFDDYLCLHHKGLM